MAYTLSKPDFTIKHLFSDDFTISGTVRNIANNALARTILVFKNGNMTTPVATTVSSDVDASFSVTVNGNHNDYFTVIAKGLESNSENSKIYDFLRRAA